MKLTVDREDLKPEHKDISCLLTKLHHFKPEVQAVIIAAGHAIFEEYDRRSYNRILIPRAMERGLSTTKYLATFDPQAWLNDNAITVDAQGPTEWDCTAFIEEAIAENHPYFGAKFQHEMDRFGYFLDEQDLLKEDPAAPEWIREWQGPFTITIKRD
jgi:hypothetical protein